MTEDPNKETLDQNSQEPEGPAEETTAETTADNPQPDVAEAAAADGAQGTAAPAQTPAEKTPAEEIAELKDKLLRSLAENENQIRRARRDREDATKYAAANFARDMLGVADNIRRAMEAVPDGLNQEDAAVKALALGGPGERRLARRVFESRCGVDKAAIEEHDALKISRVLVILCRKG